ncbi:MAG: AraC family transcriptional regulator ligand-binding domain-containing protein [Oleiphilus sp.]
MLDEIYLRLLVELIPGTVKFTQLDIKRLIDQFNEGSRAKAAYAEIIKAVYNDNPDSNIGLAFGKHLHPSTLCDLSRTLMTTDTFQQMIKLVELYHFTHGVSYFPSTHHQPGSFSIALTYPYKVHTNLYQRRFCGEAVFSYITNSLHEIVASHLQPTEVCFDFPEPSYSDEYACWQCPIKFDQPLSLIRFEDGFFQQNLITRNEVLHPIYLNKCLDGWRKSERLHELEYRAISLMMQHHPHAFNSEQLANSLNISVRGLQKRLSKQGESFSHLANLARRELSKVYLFQKGHDTEFTAEQLGFQSSSGFRRFFKQEFQLTPAEYRKTFSTEVAD